MSRYAEAALEELGGYKIVLRGEMPIKVGFVKNRKQKQNNNKKMSVGGHLNAIMSFYQYRDLHVQT